MTAWKGNRRVREVLMMQRQVRQVKGGKMCGAQKRISGGVGGAERAKFVRRQFRCARTRGRVLACGRAGAGLRAAGV